MLTFIFMNTLYLHIENRIWIDNNPSALLDQSCKLLFISTLNLTPRLAEARICNHRF